MAVNHEIPKCSCGKFMALKHTTEDRFGNTVYVYYCDNEKCGNNKLIQVIEPKK
jgi:hypothetical protein